MDFAVSERLETILEMIQEFVDKKLVVVTEFDAPP